jgi:pimeloyl-ACP methyl ester carboxylesterase
MCCVDSIRKLVARASCAVLAMALAVPLSRADDAIPSSTPPAEAEAAAAVSPAGSGRDATEAEPGGLRQWLRGQLVSEDDLARYGLRLDDGWQEADAGRPVVLLVHGFNSTPERSAPLLAPVRAAEYPCGIFAYPNDDRLSTSAELLSRELRRFAAEHPGRRVSLVCHSMGGLVARGCVEDETLDPGNVERLIMVAPPSHGSQFARVAVGIDLWEHGWGRKSGGPWRRIRDSVVDGLGEAADDLSPHSEFLAKLNGRPRNPAVRYSIFLGTDSWVDESCMDWLRRNVCEPLAKWTGGRNDGLSAAFRDDIDELVDGRGDGVVAVNRGRLEGVDDTVVMSFSHMAVAEDGHGEQIQAVHQAVLERLR